MIKSIWPCISKGLISSLLRKSLVHMIVDSNMRMFTPLVASFYVVGGCWAAPMLPFHDNSSCDIVKTFPSLFSLLLQVRKEEKSLHSAPFTAMLARPAQWKSHTKKSQSYHELKLVNIQKQIENNQFFLLSTGMEYIDCGVKLKQKSTRQAFDYNKLYFQLWGLSWREEW